MTALASSLLAAVLALTISSRQRHSSIIGGVPAPSSVWFSLFSLQARARVCVCLRRTISYLTNLFSTHTHTHTWTETERSYSFFSFFFLFVCVSCGKTSSIRLLPLLVFIQTDKGVEERDDHCSEFFTRPTRHLATDTALLKYVSIVNLFQLFTASLTLLCFFFLPEFPFFFFSSLS